MNYEKQINSQKRQINKLPGIDSLIEKGSGLQAENMEMRDTGGISQSRILELFKDDSVNRRKIVTQRAHLIIRNAVKKLFKTKNLLRLSSRLAYGSCLLLIFIVLGLSQITLGQDLTSRPDRGFGGKGGYQSSDIDSISLQNGSVNVEIPLASLPPVAGGKLSYTLSAHYNSKLWDAHRSEVQGSVSTPGCQPSYSTTEIRTADNAGWRIGGQYQIVFRDAHEDYDYLPASSEQCYGYEFNYMQGYFFKPMLRMPDGSEHEMRIEGSFNTYSVLGTRDHLKRYYQQSGGSPGYPTFSSPIRLYTIDGTFITAVVNPTGSAISSVIYLKDGTTIEDSADGQRIKDTNGNSILVNYAFVRDEQTGREIKWVGATYNGQPATKVEYQTVGGTWVSTYVVWGETTVQGKLYYKSSWNMSGGETGEGVECYIHQQVPNTPFSVIREIVLPATEQNTAARKFTFGYNSDTTTQATSTNMRWACLESFPDYTRTVSTGSGELSDVTTPTGAQIKYNYSNDGLHDIGSMSQDSADEFLRDTITTKTITHDGTTDTWQYGISSGGGNAVTIGSVINPDGSNHFEAYHPINIANAQGYGSYGFAGLTFKSMESGRISTEKTWMLLGGTVPAFGAIEPVGVNPVVDTEYTTLYDDNGNRLKMNARKFQYDYNGELLQTIEYDWFDPAAVSFVQNRPNGIPAGAVVLRTVNNSYYNQAADANSTNAYHKRSVGTSTVILGAPQEAIVGNSQTRISYDGQSFGTAPIKGNVTGISKWDSFNSSWLNTSSTYDNYGNVTSTTDPKGGVTQILYEDATHTMPTKTIIDPQNGSGQQISTATYDFSTGAVLSQTDIHGNVSNIDYTNLLLGTVDPFGRPGTVLSPATNINGTNKRQTAKTFYEDSARKVRSEADLFDQGDGLAKSRVSADQLGRPVLSERNENGASTYSVFSQTIYNTAGRAVLQSNPTRGTGESTDGWTRVTNDVLGRPIEAATFAGATQPAWTGTSGNFTGAVTTLFDTNATTVTDQAGKQRRSIINGIGQLIRVDEPDNSGSLGTAASPAQATAYAYDVLGNLTQVNQGAQTRTFSYDSLSRLRQAANPESGAISYNYDANGNLTSKTDARGVVTGYTYDAFNRVLTRSYSDGTPQVNYTYEDAGIAYSKGRLTRVSSAISETRYNSFDNLGRVLSSQQLTDGNAYNFGYTYNLSGALVSEAYPSGRVVVNQFQADGSLAQVNGLVNQTSKTYAANFNYNAMGAVNSMQLGNSKWENAQFNSRLQPTQLGLGNSTNDTSLWKVNYDYGTTNNNGNVLSQTITVPSINPLIQTYAYDSLNRIKSATETQNSSQTWKQTFTYDRYGNRNFDAANTTTLGSCPAAQCNPAVDAQNNRFTSGQGYTYDLSGNLVTDAQNRSFVYDANNKQKELFTSTNQTQTPDASYIYDGYGKRVKKVSGSEITIFVYDAAGDLIAEYLLSNSQANQTPITQYLTTDILDSPRVISDQNGQIVSRRDFMPFGEDILGIGGRNSTIGYDVDDVSQKFTGYERDDESGLDYAQARYLSNQQGRFTSPDPLMASASVYSPQTFNRYIYVSNNPLNSTDPTGMKAQTDDKNNGCPEGAICDENGNITIGVAGTVVVNAPAPKVAPPVEIPGNTPIIETPWWLIRVLKGLRTGAEFTGKGIVRVGSAVAFILTNPTSTGCGADGRRMDPETGNCVGKSRFDVDLSDEEEEPSADKPEENPTEEQTPDDTKKKKDKKKREKGKRNRFKTVGDTIQQLTEITKAQQDLRKGKGKGKVIIDDTTKSKQRVDNKIRKTIRNLEDALRDADDH